MHPDNKGFGIQDDDDDEEGGDEDDYWIIDLRFFLVAWEGSVADKKEARIYEAGLVWTGLDLLMFRRKGDLKRLRPKKLPIAMPRS